MPAYPTHTLFSHMALLALADAGHPLARVAQHHQGMFRIAGIAGCDIQCMPYQVCQNCEAPYRHNQQENRKCLVCGKNALKNFFVALEDERQIGRVEIERNLYRNTHLVLGRRPRPYGVDPKIPAGPAEQPFPEQVVRHLTNVLRDAEKIAGPRNEISNYLAFTLGWFSHVVSDAIFKGVYPHSVRIQFFGHQYNMEMLPAAETLTMTDISNDFGVHWPTWHSELLNDEPDGGALRHLAMGNEPEHYNQDYWTPEFGQPDPAIGRVLDAVRPVNRTWFHRMYLTPDYSAPTPALDRRKIAERAEWKFNDLNLGELRRYAIGTGWYQAFTKGIDIYVRIVNEATDRAGVKPPVLPGAADADRSANPGFVGWNIWSEIIDTAREVRGDAPRAADWGSRLEVLPEAVLLIRKLRGQPVRLVLPNRPTEYQRLIADTLQARWKLKVQENAAISVIIGPPVFTPDASETLCREDLLRLKYDAGLAGIISGNISGDTLNLAGLSDYGDRQIANWLSSHAQ